MVTSMTFIRRDILLFWRGHLWYPSSLVLFFFWLASIIPHCKLFSGQYLWFIACMWIQQSLRYQLIQWLFLMQLPVYPRCHQNFCYFQLLTFKRNVKDLNYSTLSFFFFLQAHSHCCMSLLTTFSNNLCLMSTFPK